ncbi:membrane protein [Sphingomonas zeicaulis]|uniref:YihY/virulence factor BrkB family protein n=1 Tax=Sphingomonas zeicaulis TaxID=1632740 RepID=UPI003D1CFB13
MPEISPQSPEERRTRLEAARAAVGGQLDKHYARIKPGKRTLEILKRVAVGVYSDGLIHAGNLAYLALLTLFPFFIVAAAIGRLAGRTRDGILAVDAFLRTVPPGVATVLKQPINDVLNARTGNLLWFGALIGLWTTASFIETIRDILRRAYGVRNNRPFWEYRLGSIGMIIGAVILLMVAFSFQVVLVGVEQFIRRVLPFAGDTAALIAAGRTAPGIALFGAMYMLYYWLTPRAYRSRAYPKWPGAMMTTLWWLGVTAAMPIVLSNIGSYDLTYGSLAGVMIALVFFFLVGLGVVIGAELNAALAEIPVVGLKDGETKPDEQGATAK